MERDFRLDEAEDQERREAARAAGLEAVFATKASVTVRRGPGLANSKLLDD